MIENIFPTPIYWDIIDDGGIVKDEVGLALSKTNFDMKPGWNSHYLSDVNFNEKNFIEDNNLINLKAQIFYHLENYLWGIGAKSVTPKIVESWASLFRKNSYGHIHSHAQSDIAGVYYFKTNGDDGNIFFEAPAPNLDTSTHFQHLAGRYCHKPVDGKLILFPAWLRHGIETNTTDSDRISISFNIIMPRYDSEVV